MGADVDCGAHVSLTGTGSSATRQCSSLSLMRRCGFPLASLARVASRSGAEGESARFLQYMVFCLKGVCSLWVFQKAVTLWKHGPFVDPAAAHSEGVH